MDALDFTDQLLTIAGEIMEDVSVVAIVRDDPSRLRRARQVRDAGLAVAAIGVAAIVLSDFGAVDKVAD